MSLRMSAVDKSSSGFKRVLASLAFFLSVQTSLLTAEDTRNSRADATIDESASEDLTSDYRGAAEPSTELAAFGLGVRESGWKSAEDEKAGFRLPPGFRVKLFASEPLIAKPLNMAWDWKGRLWVTNTVEYPYPAAEGEGDDSIKILEDTNGDGAADKVTTFADGLNIPMGLIPVHDGVVCFSIPYIWHLRDTDGDDHVDERVRLLGPFDTSRDTHGMVNALRRGLDGWIYACHGFNNQSRVRAADGSSVELTSGNTFRFKADGSRIEQVTQGQVNPFGQTQDRYGNFFSADCHSKPLTALLESACYPSFGRPDDGLGFAPEMMQHLHGSTAISGLALYQDFAFPSAYRDKFYSGNVMTSRINCNSLEWQGATGEAKEQVDFLTSDDSWFRPVDLNVGPDGALYVADFYNKIIGHYEVPLEHPERDRTSGRIWRIDYVGNDSTVHSNARTSLLVPNDRSSSVLAQLKRLAATRREQSDGRVLELTPNQLRWWADAFEASHTRTDIDELNRVLRDDKSRQVHPIAYIALTRVGGLEDETLSHLLSRIPALLAQSVSADARPTGSSMHLCRIFRSTRGLKPEQREQVLRVAQAMVAERRDSVTFPQSFRAAVECLGQFGNLEHLESVADVFRATETKTDQALHHSAKIALRALLEQPGSLTTYTAMHDGNFPQDLAIVLPGIPSEESMLTLLETLRRHESDSDVQALLRSKAEAMLLTYLPTSDAAVSRVLEYVEWASAGDVLEEGKLIARIVSKTRSRGEVLNGKFRARLNAMLTELVREISKSIESESAGWELAFWREPDANAWSFQSRKRRDGQPSRLRSSHTLGESYTGVLRSEVFDCPGRLSFWLAGHNGFPDEDDLQANAIRLIDAKSGEVIQEAYPPRNDVARRVEWNTKSLKGKRVFVECLDACDLDAYAWIAFGNFELETQSAGDSRSRVVDDAELQVAVETLGTLLRAGVANPTPELESQVRSLLDNLPEDSVLRGQVLGDWLKGTGRPAQAVLCEFALELGTLDGVVLLGLEMDASDVAGKLCSLSTIAQQNALARRLSENSQGLELLSELLSSGPLSVRAMQGIASEQVPISVPKAMRNILLDAILANGSAVQEIDLSAWESAVMDGSANVETGKRLYAKHCQNCHQLRGQGLVVGPQLDGVVVRSQSRLLQDILLPNANVDRAFRQSTFLLDNDEIVRGVAVPKANGILRVVDSHGNEREIAESQIVSRKDGGLSLMPANFHELLAPEELRSLIAFIKQTADEPDEAAGRDR